MQPTAINNLRALILDMDGVLWRGSTLIAPLAPIFNTIKQRGWRVLMLTNNSTRTPAQYLQKVAEFGVQLEPWQVMNSAEATAQYMAKQHPQGGPVYIIGEEGLHLTLAAQGFHQEAENDQAVLAVVAGLDRALSYPKLRRATLLLRNGDVPFIGTNPDRTFPTPEGLVPGAGTVLAAIETASDVTPQIIGKPKPEMYRAALERLGTRPEETLVVGDRLDTDIAGGHGVGCHTALVLSGITTAAQAQASPLKPDLVATDLTALLKMLT